MQGFGCSTAAHRKYGYSNLGIGTDQQFWVCGACRRPEANMTRWEADTMLNFFRGGHLDGLAYATADLLQPSALPLRVDRYRWTPETITSERTGATARVWIFIEEDE